MERSVEMGIGRVSERVHERVSRLREILDMEGKLEREMVIFRCHK